MSTLVKIIIAILIIGFIIAILYLLFLWDFLNIFKKLDEDFVSTAGLRDQIALKHAKDPWFIHYFGNQKDITGRSRKDYFLENELFRRNTGVKAAVPFGNNNCYLSMPSYYRPPWLNDCENDVCLCPTFVDNPY